MMWVRHWVVEMPLGPELTSVIYQLTPSLHFPGYSCIFIFPYKPLSHFVYLKNISKFLLELAIN